MAKADEAQPASQPEAKAFASSPAIGAESSLRDVRGSRHALDEFRGSPAIVLAFWGTRCPLANQYVPHLLEIYRRFKRQNVEFVLIYPNEHDTLDLIAAHALEFDIPFLVLKDIEQQLATQLDVRRTPTICVLDSRLRLRYRGRIDRRYGVGHRSDKPGRNDLVEALTEVLQGKEPSVAETAVDGCLIEPRRPPRLDPVDYATQVAPLIDRRCGNCHRPEGQAPFSLSTYDDVSAWGHMIREVVGEGRMPPWHADRRYGPYVNDRSLSTKEAADLLAWIDQGMPRGDGDPPPPAPKPAHRWSLDRVDAIVECPDEHQIPAEGVLDYAYSLVPRDVTNRVFNEDRWIQAVEVLPSNPAVVHHIQVNIHRPGAVMRAGLENVVDADLIGIIGWAPGKLEFAFPAGTGMRVPKGTQIMFEIHYTPNGRPAKDRPAMAIRFADAPPRKEIRTLVPFIWDIKIPPGEPHYRLEGSYQFTEPTRLLSINPHMHLRGKAFHCDAVWPDGTRRRLLSVPRYDFNWQTYYWLAEPPLMPPGSRLAFTAWWDNSRHNLNNPDPTATVTWGIQSANEMMTCFLFGEVDRATADSAGVSVAIPVADPHAKRLVVTHMVIHVFLPLLLKALIAVAALVLLWKAIAKGVRRMRRIPQP